MYGRTSSGIQFIYKGVIMGDRPRLGRIHKDMKDAVKGMSLDEVRKHFGIESVYNNMPSYEQLYDIGNVVDFYEDPMPFFDFKVYEETDTEFFIMSKKQLADVIKSYSDDIHKYYKKMLDKFRNPKYDSTRDIDCFLLENTISWSQKHFPMYYLDETVHDGNITPYWVKEYAIFNLVEIYRNFDWDNDYLIYSVW